MDVMAYYCKNGVYVWLCKQLSLSGTVVAWEGNDSFVALPLSFLLKTDVELGTHTKLNVILLLQLWGCADRKGA